MKCTVGSLHLGLEAVVSLQVLFPAQINERCGDIMSIWQSIHEHQSIVEVFVAWYSECIVCHVLIVILLVLYVFLLFELLSFLPMKWGELKKNDVTSMAKTKAVFVCI